MPTIMRTPLPLTTLALWLVPAAVAAQTGSAASRRPSTDTRFSAQTTRQGFTLNFVKGMPPSEVGVGVSIFNLRMSFPLSGTGYSTYRFLFDPGDLGRRRFDGETLRVEDGVLIMTRNGHPMRYVRG